MNMDFTNIEFAVAPPANDGQNEPQPQPVDLGVPSFPPGTAVTDIPGADPVPVGKAGQRDSPTIGSSALEAGVAKAEEIKDERTAANNVDDIYTLPGGVDDMILDFDLGGTGNADPSSFDDMFFDADLTMESGEFDQSYFGPDP
jgi:hypothetical protein